MEKTFAIIKPDARRNKHVGAVISMIEKAGFSIVQMKQINLTQEQAEDLYAEHKDKPFFDEMVAAMKSEPIVVFELQKENAVKAWRDLMGATNPADADQGTIRALYAESIGANTVHGSDSSESAQRELAIFF